MRAERKEDTYRDYVLNQLQSLEGVSCRTMFDGYGLYLNADFFGIIYGNTLYFRTDESTRQEYTNRGMDPFSPGGILILKAYYEVPEEIVESHEELACWAIDAAMCRVGKKERAPAVKKRIEDRI